MKSPANAVALGRGGYARITLRRVVALSALSAVMCVNLRVPSLADRGEGLPKVSGGQLDLGSLRGKPVVLNFWAFWCDTWKAELPHLKRLADRQGEAGFRLVAISVDGTRVEEFRKRVTQPLPFPVLLDPGSRFSRVHHVERVPTVIILDSAGRERWRRSGYPGSEAIVSALRSLSAAPSAPPAVVRATRSSRN